MAKFTVKTADGTNMTRHRAECKKHRYTGDWHVKRQDAIDDATLHKQQIEAPHQIMIVTEQKTKQLYK